MTSPSKYSYMGQNLRRLPRSELDDSIMRDLNRYDTRLTENLRTVERARGVVLKSLESDKKNFIRGGINNNKKVVKSTTKSPNDTRQASAITLQHPKYFSDMRTRRAYEQMIMSRRPSAEIINSFKPVRSKTDLSDTQRGLKKTVDTGSEDDLNDNDLYRPNSVDNGFTTSKEEERSKYGRTPSTSPSESGPGPRASTTPTIKIDDYDRVSTSPHREDDTKPGVSDLVNGRDKNASPTGSVTNTTPEMTKRQSSFVLDRSTNLPSTMPLPFTDDYYFSRRQTFWDYLSTPKNPSLNRQKREQLELEFAMRSQESAAAHKSAKGQRTLPGKGVTTTTKIVTTPRVKSSTSKRSGTVTVSRPTKLTGTSKGKQQGNK